MNSPDDVRAVQILLNRNLHFITPLRPLATDGRFGKITEMALRLFQERAVRLARPDAVANPKGPTIRALNGKSAESQSATSSSKGGIAGLTEDQLNAAAQLLGCEVAAVKAVVKTELGVRSAFDAQGRPTILYERHYFHKLTQGKYDKSDPDLSSPLAGGYDKFSEQYPKLERAMKLDKAAALKSASWGAFQIMGANHVAAGHASVDSFVAAMKRSVADQADAFVNFVKSDAVLKKSICEKDWTTFAKRYNGPGYAKNAYDTKMKENYEALTKK